MNKHRELISRASHLLGDVFSSDIAVQLLAALREEVARGDALQAQVQAQNVKLEKLRIERSKIIQQRDDARRERDETEREIAAWLRRDPVHAQPVVKAIVDMIESGAYRRTERAKGERK